MNKRPIDLQRDGAGEMEVGTPDDPSALAAIFAIGGALYGIKESGVYLIKMADDIDPARSNPKIPNTQQRVLSVGSSSPLLGRTLLTAQGLFNKNVLPETIDCDQALILVFEATKDIIGLDEISKEIKTAIAQAQSPYEGRARKDGSLLVPAVGNLEGRCKAFIQRADHALQNTLKVAKIFYGEEAGRKWFESLAERIKSCHGEESDFSVFLEASLPLLKFIRNARNCVEHPKPHQRVVVTDFSLGADGNVWPPTIQVVDTQAAQPAIPISAFMEQINEHLVSFIELLIAFICGMNMRSIGEVPFQVVEFPEGKRPRQNVRFGYGVRIGDQFVPVSIG